MDNWKKILLVSSIVEILVFTINYFFFSVSPAAKVIFGCFFAAKIIHYSYAFKVERGKMPIGRYLSIAFTVMLYYYTDKAFKSILSSKVEFLDVKFTSFDWLIIIGVFVIVCFINSTFPAII